jgi:hypothetical protein
VERIVVSPDGRGFVEARSGRAFHPWGFNYGNAGRLMEDFWIEDWRTLENDFLEMRQLGANVVRVHLQYGKFMDAPDRPNREAHAQLRRLVRLAGRTGLRLDVTGLACYRPGDTPAWYDRMGEAERWAAQAAFWREVARTCAGSPAVFCYDLINEPVAPAVRREPGQWRSGHLFGDFDFLQYIALDPAGRERADTAAAWIRAMTAAIRSQDTSTLITVGLLPWGRPWKHLSGFLPEKVAPELDFVSVHIYPDTTKPGEAMEGLAKFQVGKPVVIEETFALSCPIAEAERFLRDSRTIACGWIGHYDGQTPVEADALEAAGKLSLHDAIYREWLRLFVRLTPEFAPAREPPPLATRPARRAPPPPRGGSPARPPDSG